MEALRKQFSLDYLVPDKAKVTPTETAGTRALDEAVIVFSDPIFKVLETAPNREIRVHELISQVDKLKSVSSFESFMEVINRLENLKFIEIVETDITGNHLIRLLRRP